MKPALIAVIVLTAIALILVGSASIGFMRQGFVGSATPSFTMYYADWCPHCQQVKPMFQQFAASGSVNVNGKDIKLQMVSPEKEPEKMGGVQVKGYPTFLYSDAAGKTLEYNGPRTPDGFMEFLKQQVLA